MTPRVHKTRIGEGTEVGSRCRGEDGFFFRMSPLGSLALVLISGLITAAAFGSHFGESMSALRGDNFGQGCPPGYVYSGASACSEATWFMVGRIAGLIFLLNFALLIWAILRIAFSKD